MRGRRRRKEEGREGGWKGRKDIVENEGEGGRREIREEKGYREEGEGGRGGGERMSGSSRRYIVKTLTC
jgi:hypothetical protein